MTQLKELKDHFGTKVDIGDILLGARGKKGHWDDTEFNFVVVIGRTKGMLRVHQLGGHPVFIRKPNDEILEDVEHRRGRQGGRANSFDFVKVRSTGITQAEFDKAVEKQAQTVNVSSAPIDLSF